MFRGFVVMVGAMGGKARTCDVCRLRSWCFTLGRWGATRVLENECDIIRALP